MSVKPGPPLPPRVQASEELEQPAHSNRSPSGPGSIGSEHRTGNGKLVRPMLGGNPGRLPNSLGSGSMRRRRVGRAVPRRTARLRANGELAVRSAALPNRSLEWTGLKAAAKVGGLHPAAQLRSWISSESWQTSPCRLFAFSRTRRCQIDVDADNAHGLPILSER